MSDYMFESKEITGSTAFELQEAACLEALVCTKVRDVEQAGPVFKLRNPFSEEICFVFSDEVGLFSNPYRTEDEAAAASKRYADSL